MPLTNPENERCELCRFYLVKHDSDRATREGSCRRYPPPGFFETSTQIAIHSGFPTVSAYTWCGEFKDFERFELELPSELLITNLHGTGEPAAVKHIKYIPVPGTVAPVHLVLERLSSYEPKVTSLRAWVFSPQWPSSEWTATNPYIATTEFPLRFRCTLQQHDFDRAIDIRVAAP